jgi:hypothetical protein
MGTLEEKVIWHKLRIQRAKQIVYEFVSNAELKKRLDELEVDGSVTTVNVTEVDKPMSPEELREYKEKVQSGYSKGGRDPHADFYQTGLQLAGQFTASTSVPESSSQPGENEILVEPAKDYRAKPYTIENVNFADRVQIQNFARLVCEDPAFNPFPPHVDCTNEMMFAKLEYQWAMYQATLEECKSRKIVEARKQVDAIRNEGEFQRKQKIEKRENAPKKESTVDGKAKAAVKLANELQLPKQHKDLLKNIVVMGLDIPGYSTMTFEQLTAAFKKAMAE